MTNNNICGAVARWRALPDCEKTNRRRAAVVDHVVHSMAMEGEPVSRQWVTNARHLQTVALSAH
ncbi:hypothetical protein [Rhodococcus sp. 1139]|uniref:hypothetical protein n=1 Tax=Rhodococcus sp. 1139 TaxID=1833762 RepID=UPI0009F3A6BF|nr:hypothetical protein [Rhodococcus sp. 1139]